MPGTRRSGTRLCKSSDLIKSENSGLGDSFASGNGHNQQPQEQSNKQLNEEQILTSRSNILKGINKIESLETEEISEAIDNTRLKDTQEKRETVEGKGEQEVIGSLQQEDFELAKVMDEGFIDVVQVKQRLKSIMENRELNSEKDKNKNPVVGQLSVSVKDNVKLHFPETTTFG